MKTFALRTDLERLRVGSHWLPLGLEPVDLPAPAHGYTVTEADMPEDAPPALRFYAVTSIEKVESLLDDLFELLPDEVFPLLEATSRDAFRTVDVFAAEEPMPFDEFRRVLKEYRDVIVEDGSLSVGAESEEPAMEVVLDSWKGVDVLVPVSMRDEVERIMASHGLEEVAETWPSDLDERPEPPFKPREILQLDDRQCPDLDEIIFQLRESWGLELDEDPEDNLDERGRHVGRTLWDAVAIVEGADEDEPRLGYLFAWVTAGSIAEVQQMIESRLELQDEWRFTGQWYTLDRVAFDDRPEFLQSLSPRRTYSEIHKFTIEPA
jgi:hypothetical protein